jgi:sortase A
MDRKGKVIQKIMIVLGWLLLFFAVTRVYADYRKATSPFDQVSAPKQEDDKGFIPYILPVEAQVEEASAPTLIPEQNEISSAQSAYTKNKALLISEPKVVEKMLLQAADQYDPVLTNQKMEHSKNPATYIPDRLVIEAISLDAPVIPVEYKEIDYQDQVYQQWVAPDEYAAGWHRTSASLGVKGNTVLNGHHNIFDEVFVDLDKIKSGDIIQVYSGNVRFSYVVANTMILEERFQPVETRIGNARWIQPSGDERLTLVTCWPYESNTHRVIVVAIPIGVEDVSINLNGILD